MKILLTNDDGIHARGLIEMGKFLVEQKHEVFLVAPETEQSGMSSAITYLRPLMAKSIKTRILADTFVDGCMVNGTPVDCVRLGLSELCPWKPDLVLSGINDGLNAGTNVNYSGTVAAAMTAASLGYTAMAISIESSANPQYRSAIESALPVIDRLTTKPLPKGVFTNLNFPTAAIESGPNFDFLIVPSETNPMGYQFAKGTDPKNRQYYWATNSPGPEPSEFMTDTQALLAGNITLTTLSSNLNDDHGRQLIDDLLK
jgi:5'-nucleotidase